MPRKPVEKYIEEIRDIHNSFLFYPDSETLRKRRHDKLEAELSYVNDALGVVQE
ncbi:hypothetical protein SAMN02910340_02073 [Methanosarcina thermophila]|uniref:Uncharacterized protein n=1 Tax=Methanosarcina thermophila TaxID=2210 RepID=A0A1I7ADZ4_METTE|nr:hypothetical protein [Methanosarcina thermophila]GLI14216.1 hypothetical protein MTHERMMSTA1_13420 [Methanosarcina thermophila MST-A1]SFT73161.1 hypothetical protein SAMN02910340_02073 [Methanosarcina thermophila]